MSRAARIGGAIVLVVHLAAGCAGDDNADPDTVAPTSVANTSTASSSTSSPPETTATTSASTLPVTTTTIDAAAATRTAVAAAAVQSRQDYLYAVQNYDAPDVLDVLGRTAAANSPSFQQGIDNMENLRSNGWRVRPNPEVPSALTVEGDVSLLNGPPATRAELTVCVVGAGIVFEPGTGPGGADTIVNDEVNARRTRVTMVLEEGAWKVYSGELIDSWNGQASCPGV